MPDWLQTIPPKYWLAVALVAFGVAWPYLGSLKPALGKLTPLFKADPSSKRKAALASLDDAITYLESLKCEAGVKALKDALPHFYHQHGSQS